LGGIETPISAKGGFFLGLQHQLHEFSVSQFHQQVGFKGNQLDIAEPNIGSQS